MPHVNKQFHPTLKSKPTKYDTFCDTHTSSEQSGGICIHDLEKQLWLWLHQAKFHQYLTELVFQLAVTFPGVPYIIIIDDRIAGLEFPSHMLLLPREILFSPKENAVCTLHNRACGRDSGVRYFFIIIVMIMIINLLDAVEAHARLILTDMMINMRLENSICAIMRCEGFYSTKNCLPDWKELLIQNLKLLEI